MENINREALDAMLDDPELTGYVVPKYKLKFIQFKIFGVTFRLEKFIADFQPEGVPCNNDFFKRIEKPIKVNHNLYTEFDYIRNKTEGIQYRASIQKQEDERLKKFMVAFPEKVTKELVDAIHKYEEENKQRDIDIIIEQKLLHKNFWYKIGIRN